MRRLAMLGALCSVVLALGVAVANAAPVVSNTGLPAPLVTHNAGACGGPASGSYTHVNGPAAPPLGSGSLKMDSGATPNFFGIARSFSNMAASSLTAFSAWHNEPASTAPGSVSMEIDALQTASASTTDFLFLQPANTNGAWQSVDLMSAILQFTRGGTSSSMTYATYLQNNPDAVVYSVEVYVHTCNTTDQVAYIDDLVIGVDGVNSTYDFEAPKATLTPTNASTTITAGQSVTTGVRARKATDGTPIAGESVRLYAKTYPATTYHLLATKTTDANGYASDKVTPLVATTYRWTLPPQAFAPVTSATRSVKVRTRLTAHVSDTTLTRTQNLVLKGSTYKHRPGATVQLRRITSTGSTLVQSVKVASDGTYRFRHTLPAGKRRVYVHIGSGSGELANNSRTISVTVSS